MLQKEKKKYRSLYDSFRHSSSEIQTRTHTHTPVSFDLSSFVLPFISGMQLSLFLGSRSLPRRSAHPFPYSISSREQRLRTAAGSKSNLPPSRQPLVGNHFFFVPAPPRPRERRNLFPLLLDIPFEVYTHLQTTTNGHRRQRISWPRRQSAGDTSWRRKQPRAGRS